MPRPNPNANNGEHRRCCPRCPPGGGSRIRPNHRQNPRPHVGRQTTTTSSRREKAGLGVHCADGVNLVLKYANGKRVSREMLPAPIFTRNAAFVLDKPILDRVLLEKASAAIEQFKASIPDADQVYVSALANDEQRNLISIHIFGEGSKSEFGCTGHGSCNIILALTGTPGETLQLSTTQDGPAQNVRVWGDGPLCEVGDWFTH